MPTRTCSTCGTTGTCPDGGLPPGWSVGAGGRGRTTFLCVDCVRAHLRAIEGKLPEEHW